MQAWCLHFLNHGETDFSISVSTLLHIFVLELNDPPKAPNSIQFYQSDSSPPVDALQSTRNRFNSLCSQYFHYFYPISETSTCKHRYFEDSGSNHRAENHKTGHIRWHQTHQQVSETSCVSLCKTMPEQRLGNC